MSWSQNVSLLRRPLWRGIFAALAAVVGWFSVSDTLANVLVKSDPKAALALAPWKGTIAADLAQNEMSAAPVSEEQSYPAQLARKAIKLDSTAVEAFEVLGLQAQLRGNTGRARKIFTHSLALSRRELRPHIWAIEEAVSRGDIAGALRQYDIALRTSRSAPEVLFPTLAAAISEPKVREALLAMLESGPDWSGKFIEFVSRGRADPAAAISFFREGERARIPIGDANRTSLVNLLVGRGKVQLGWNYYSSFRNVMKNESRNPNFSAIVEKPAVFDWNPRNSAGISASIQRVRNGGVFNFSAAPSVGGVVLDQRQVLPPGNYHFESTIEDLEQPDYSRPQWVLTCQGGQQLGKVEVPNSLARRLKYNGHFSVPSGCSVQTLALVVLPSDEISGVSGRIFSARIVPANDGGALRDTYD